MIHILKYKLAPQHEQVLQFAGAVLPLHVAVDNGDAYLWAQVNDAAGPRGHRVHIYATGDDVVMADEPTAMYVGTYRLAEGRKMWHVYLDYKVVAVPAADPGDEEGLVLVNEKATTEL